MKKFFLAFLFFVVALSVICLPVAAEGPQPKAYRTNVLDVKPTGVWHTKIQVSGVFLDLCLNRAPYRDVASYGEVTITVLPGAKTIKAFFVYERWGMEVKVYLGEVLPDGKPHTFFLPLGEGESGTVRLEQKSSLSIKGKCFCK